MIILLRDVHIHKQKKEPEQIQKMYNLDVDQTALKVLVTRYCMKISLEQVQMITIVDHLNL